MPILQTIGYSGDVVNPGAAAVLADSGPLAASAYQVIVVLWGSVAAQYQIVRRNAANTADVQVAEGQVGAGGVVSLTFFFSLVVNERVVIRNVTALVGTANVALFVFTP